MDSDIDWKMDELLVTEDSNQQPEVQAEASHWRSTPEIDLRLFNTFISGLDDWKECSLSKFEDSAKLGRVVDTLYHCAAIQNNL